MQPKPKKSLGQNFLIDRNIQEKIIRSAGLKKNDLVLEIGPGRGEISAGIIPLVKKLIAVEIDPQLCQFLKDKFSACQNFELINQDILKIDIPGLCPPGEKLKVIANLPYYISTPAITHLLKYKQHIREIYLTLQKELAQRLCACPGSKAYGAFSCFTQFHTRPEILFEIKSAAFWPKPKVDSSFIRLNVPSKPRIKIEDEERFFRLIRAAFNQRRKQLKNSLKKILSPQAFLKSGIDPGSRPEELSLSDFALLANNFYVII